MLGALGTFLDQLNPILGWLSDHQQLISDFISNGATGIAATTTSFAGGGIGHYLRQFSPVGSETLSFATNRDSDNRGNTYPGPVWLNNAMNFAKGNFPSWDCKNTGAGGDGSTAGNGEPSSTPGSRGAVLGGADAAGRAAGSDPAPARGDLPGQVGARPLARAGRFGLRRCAGAVGLGGRAGAVRGASAERRAGRRAACRRAAGRRSARARHGRARARTP